MRAATLMIVRNIVTGGAWRVSETDSDNDRR